MALFLISFFVVRTAALTEEIATPIETAEVKRLDREISLNQNSAPASGVASPVDEAQIARRTFGMKLVNEDVTDEDLDSLSDLGITIIEGEWGMEDATPQQVLVLLDRVRARDMKLIMNFTDESAWGYGEEKKNTTKPVWQSEAVQSYVRALKNHPALYGYDISNEAGENLPHGDSVRITAEQMLAAANDVRTIDATHPILMRMHYWDRFDGDFTAANPFAAGIADIVMLNLYSNWTRDGMKPETPNMLFLSGQSLVDTVKAVDPHARVWIALAAFREQPYFLKPSAADLQRDIDATLSIKGIENISFFGFGPERYPNEGSGWDLTRDGKDLLEVMRNAIARSR